MNKISVWFYRFSTGKSVLLFLLIFVLFSILVLPKQSADANSYGGDVGSPDLSFYYTSEELHKMAEAYGKEGRDAYIQARFTFDILWPIVYGAFLITTISKLFLKSIPTYSWLRSLNLLPIFGMMFDYLENISTSAVMWQYPTRIALIGTLAPIFTSIKWILLALSFLMVVVGTVLVLKNRFKNSF